MSKLTLTKSDGSTVQIEIEYVNKFSNNSLFDSMTQEVIASFNEAESLQQETRSVQETEIYTCIEGNFIMYGADSDIQITADTLLNPVILN